MPATAAEYTDRRRFVARNAPKRRELPGILPKSSACYPTCIMLLLPHGPACSGTACLLLASALVLACSSDDTPSGNGPTAGATNQGSGGVGQSAGRSSAQGGATTTQSGGSSGTSTTTTAGGSAVTSAGGAASGTSCSQTALVCKMAAPNCAAMQVPEMTADGSCYAGSCVPIAECTCTAATDCPDASQYTCNMGTGRCTPYLL
jgi:hypothetical protein